MERNSYSRARKASIAMLAAQAVLLTALFAACGDGDGGARHKAKPVFKNFGVVVVSDDGNGFTHGIQVIKIEDPQGKALPAPTQNFVPIAAGDLDGQSITPDGTHGAAVDGGNQVYFFESNLKNGNITVSPTTVDVSAYGGDGDSIASLPDGDEVVVSAGGSTKLAQISGVLSGTPVIAEDIATSGTAGEYDGLVISEDGKVMLSRNGDGVVDVYSIKKVAPHPGSHGGSISFDFTLAKTVSSGLPSLCCDGREGMAMSPVNSARAVLIGSDGSVALLTGLPDNPTVVSTITLPNGANAVTISRDGKYAIVATNGGLFVVQGVTGSTLSQLGAAYSPTFTTPEGTCQLNGPETLGVTFDGKYIAAIQNCGLTQSATNVGSGVLLTIPYSNGSFGNPAGQLNYVVTPNNDQLLTH